MLPVAPVADEIGIRDQDARRMFVGAEYADRLAGLDQERFVIFEGRSEATMAW